MADFGPALRKRLKEMDDATDTVEADVATLDSTKATKPLLIAGAPVTTPEYVGAMAVDPTAGNVYIAKGPTSSDWVEIQDTTP